MVAPAQFSQEPCMVLLLPGETPYILLKSAKDEYLFTDRALIFIDGESVTSPKRTITRTDYCTSSISSVVLVTPGVMDNDCSIDFIMERRWRLEIRKSEVENAKLVFKLLDSLALYKHQLSRRYDLEKFTRSEMSKANFHILPGANQADLMSSLTQNCSDWCTKMELLCLPISYKSVFESVLYGR